ncbi:MAG: metal ABC transporter ATP-binding protein [Planctomycetota bacterium]
MPADTTPTTQPGTLLEVSDLTVTLGGRCVVDGLSFTVQRGEILTILGPNGAGKTVLLRALLGSVPYAGSVTWAPGVRFGYVPQRVPYFRDTPLTVAEFFALKRVTRVEDREAVARALLAEVALDAAVLDRGIGELSSGQFQRVLIAWALLGDPDVLLFDEPTTGVDVGAEESVYRLLARLHQERGLTMLLVTHDLSLVYSLSTSVLCINRRRLCAGPPRQVLTPESLHELYGAEVKVYPHEGGAP